MADRIRFATDEHVAKAVISGLTKRGVDVLSTPAAQLLGAGDLQHLDRAGNEGRVVFTQDTDFLRLHAAGMHHSGIVYAKPGTGVGTIVRGLLLIYELLAPEEMANHVEFL